MFVQGSVVGNRSGRLKRAPLGTSTSLRITQRLPREWGPGCAPHRRSTGPSRILRAYRVTDLRVNGKNSEGITARGRWMICGERENGETEGPRFRFGCRRMEDSLPGRGAGWISLN